MKERSNILSLCLMIEQDGTSYNAIADKWRIKIRKSAGKVKRQLEQTIATEADYERKIVQPAIEAFPNMLNQDFVSKDGLNAAQIIANHKEGMMNSAAKYFKGIHKAYKTRGKVQGRAFKQIINKKAANYLSGSSDSLALSYAKYPKKSIIALALMGLASTDKIQKRFLKGTDILNGSSIARNIHIPPGGMNKSVSPAVPINRDEGLTAGYPALIKVREPQFVYNQCGINIAEPAKTGEFRKALTNQIFKSGCAILRLLGKYEKALRDRQPRSSAEVVAQFIGPDSKTAGPLPEETSSGERVEQAHQELIQAIKQGNEALNKLTDSYRRADIAPFSLSGKSHINFVLEENTTPTAPVHSGCKTNLYLDINVAKL